MYSRNKQYKKPDIEIVNSVLKHISDDHEDHDDLHFFVANLHQASFTKFADWSEDELNNLLSRNNIDISVFEKEKETNRNKNDFVFDTIIEFVSSNNGEYKKELVSHIKQKLQNLPKGKISSTLRRLTKLGIIEQSVHETTNKKIVSKGRYWNSHIGDRK